MDKNEFFVTQWIKTFAKFCFSYHEKGCLKFQHPFFKRPSSKKVSVIKIMKYRGKGLNMTKYYF